MITVPSATGLSVRTSDLLYMLPLRDIINKHGDSFQCFADDT